MLSDASKKQTLGNRNGSSELARGSLHAMNLGALIVGELAQAINWTNDPSFKKPECKPWVDVPVVSSASVDTSNGSVCETMKQPEPVDSVTTQEGVEEEIVAEVPSEPAPLETPRVVEAEEVTPDISPVASSPVASSPLPTETLSQDTIATRDETESSIRNESVEETRESRSEVVETAVNKPVEIAAEAVPQIPVKPVEEEPVSVSTADHARVAVSKDSVPTEPVKVAEKSAARSDAIEVKAPATSTAKQPRVNESPGTSRLAREVSQVPRPTSSASERPPLPKISNQSVRVDQSQDEYLIQLERLVVELNMELARARGEEQEVDPMEQMANRIIALNLENLALKEKLQQSQ